MDGAGVTLSTACLIHCLVFPLAIAILPSWSTALSLPEGFHLVMVLIAVPLTSYVLLKSRHGAGGAGSRLALGFSGLWRSKPGSRHLARHWLPPPIFSTGEAGTDHAGRRR